MWLWRVNILWPCLLRIARKWNKVRTPLLLCWSWSSSRGVFGQITSLVSSPSTHISSMQPVYSFPYLRDLKLIFASISLHAASSALFLAQVCWLSSPSCCGEPDPAWSTLRLQTFLVRLTTAARPSMLSRSASVRLCIWCTLQNVLNVRNKLNKQEGDSVS